MSDTPTRRRFVAGVAAVTAALSGCTGDGGDGGSDGNGDETTGTGGDDGSNDGSDGGGSMTASVTVGPGGELVFDPDSLEVTTGATVTFSWDSSGHNIDVESQPDSAAWGGVGEIQSEGFTHEHTFDVAGEYQYHCDPHQGSGMDATITVTEG